MPRANRRRRDERPLALGAFAALERRERYAGGEWFVRHITGRDAARSFLCPGCQHQVGGGSAHVVVWPADGLGGIDDRRHWHTRCWQARERRPPKGSYR